MDAPRETTLHANGLSFSALEQGEGPLVLCLHGFPDDRDSFRQQLPALARAGFRAVAPRLRGYEPSSQPTDGDYHLEALAGDVLGWLDDLDVPDAHLVGHDWGAIIGTATAAQAARRLRSLTTLAVPHVPRGVPLRRLPGQLRRSWYMLFFQLRGLAERVVARDDLAFLDGLWRAWSPGWSWPPEALEAVKRTFREPGVLPAALGYYRALFDFATPAGRRSLGLIRRRVDVPTLALTGARDGCLDTRFYDAMTPEDFPMGLRVMRIADAGHFLHQEQPDVVNRIVLDWLRECD